MARKTSNKVTAHTLPLEVNCCAPGLSVYGGSMKYLKVIRNLEHQPGTDPSFLLHALMDAYRGVALDGEGDGHSSEDDQQEADTVVNMCC